MKRTLVFLTLLLACTTLAMHCTTKSEAKSEVKSEVHSDTPNAVHTSTNADNQDKATQHQSSKYFTFKGQKMEKITKTDAEWRSQLGSEQYQICRNHGTERAFTGKYWNFKGNGIYTCAGCGFELFSSDTKFDSGTGWPSFWAPLTPESVETTADKSYGMVRTEVHCPRCNSHLGHVFDDGPQPTGLRYCMNSASLNFVAAVEKK
jgi:peptide-methionine (R)-S-oxide reductase